MVIIFSVLLFAVQRKINCISVKTTQGGEDIELVDLLKEDLRRNNDDYIDKLNKSTLAPAARNLTEKAPKTNIKGQLDDYIAHKKQNLMFEDAKRRNINEMNYNKYFYSPTNPHRFNTVSSSEPTKATSVAFIKPDKLDLFKQFVDRNKDLIQEYMRKKKGQKEASLRANSREQVLSPQPDQLDMAPAKGGRVHSLRIKGRLCSRHVLVPEGPKYDSGGRAYLPAAAAAGHYRTRAPRVLLPRCCNCCKKSVLGCE